MIDPFWDAAHACYCRRYRRLARMFEVISMMLSSHAVSAEIEIGDGSKFWHHGLGCVAWSGVHIGNNCKIFRNVTFGNKFGIQIENPGGVHVGDNCVIGAGAVILGHITIGNDVSIGANAVVNRDIPDHCMAVGVPARIIRKAE